jgi:hypothetical protein
MVQRNEGGFDANQIVKTFYGMTPPLAATMQLHRSSVFK